MSASPEKIHDGLGPIRLGASVASFASDCLKLEVRTYPKPGLVSHRGRGAHTDMDAAMMFRSADALRLYFGMFVREGARGAAMEDLRLIGIRAEKAMMRATGGVNTHRGAIFGLGLLCAAAGYRQRNHDSRYLPADDTPRPTLGSIVRAVWGVDILQGPTIGNSHGTIASRLFRVTGARGEAAAGFPTLYRIALPALRAAAKQHPGQYEAVRVQTLMHLIAHVDDTNLLHRGGKEGLALARADAIAFLGRGGIAAPDWFEAARDMHRRFVALNLSPGGCADLLAMALFIDGIERADLHESAAKVSKTVEPVEPVEPTTTPVV